MKEKSQELAKVNSQDLLTINSLSKKQKLLFSKTLIKLGLSKGIELKEGFIGVWAECLSEDLNKHLFTFEEFLEALKIGLRRPIYNRLDYADIYKIAIKISYFNEKEVLCPLCNNEKIKFDRFRRISEIKCEVPHGLNILDHPKIKPIVAGTLLVGKEYAELYD